MMTDNDTLVTDMARLAARPYSEVGVPMFVIAQDRTAIKGARAPISSDGNLAVRLAALAVAFTKHNPDPGLTDVARLIEVLADRHLLQLDGPRFTLISDGAD